MGVGFKMDDILIRVYRVSRKNLRQSLKKNLKGRGFKIDDILIKSPIYHNISSINRRFYRFIFNHIHQQFILIFISYI